jgi:1-acyl-sn-glycerol-3-phosphate acyltransferase
VEAGGIAGIGLGILLAVDIVIKGARGLSGSILADMAGRVSPWGLESLAAAIAIAFAAMSFLAAIGAAWPLSNWQVERRMALQGSFLDDWKRVWRRREARGALLAAAGFRGLVPILAAKILGEGLMPAYQIGKGWSDQPIWQSVIWGLAGGMAGSMIASLQGHPRRLIGLLPIGLTLLAAFLVAGAWLGMPGRGTSFLAGAGVGIVNAALLGAFLHEVPGDSYGQPAALLYFLQNLITVVLAVVLGITSQWLGSLYGAREIWLAAALAAVGAALAWRFCFREFMEQLTEVILWPVYRIYARGPGKYLVPREGPVLIVANHSAWFDPLWIAKVVPRRIIPMMTSVFYDLPLLRLLMAHVVEAIRVQAATFRRQAPELDLAIGKLDAGECLVVFPEGMLRRREDQGIRPFGRGVWHLLQQRPQTPVIVCWIEGGWGSYTSYRHGRPTTGKRMDFWRRITIAISAPQILDPRTLEDHRQTRDYLRRACAQTRAYLSLEPYPIVDIIEEDAEGAGPDTAAR